MLLDEKQNRWIVISIAIFVIGLIVYIPYSTNAGVDGPSGKSIHGLIFGVVGFVLMLFCGLLGARKAVRTWRIGKAQEWLRAHIWLGFVSFPIILFHSGMSFGKGGLTILIMWMFVGVIVSGIIGVIIQNIVPRLMLERVTHETIFEQIPHVIHQLRAEADDVIEAVCGPFDRSDTERSDSDKGGRRPKERKVRQRSFVDGTEELKNFYVSEIRTLLYPEVSELAESFSVQSTARFGRMRTVLNMELHDALDDLEFLFTERRELDLQKKLHHWMHGWLFLHVPLAYALLALSAMHAIMSLYY